MTRDEFRATFLTQKDEDCLGLCLRNQDVPFVFEPRPKSWQDFRQQLAGDLGIQVNEIAIVGSGRLGFSLKPANNLKTFSDKSDIDVVIVNPALFEELWLAFLAAAYPRSNAPNQLGGWIENRRKEIYTGWVTPLKIQLDGRIWGARAKNVNRFKYRWFTTLKSASMHSPRRHGDINARLYSSWQHAEMYHLDSLASLRKSLIT